MGIVALRAKVFNTPMWLAVERLEYNSSVPPPGLELRMNPYRCK